MKCGRCEVDKVEIDFISNGILYKQCNKCRKNQMESYYDSKKGIIPKKILLRKDREDALKKGNFICSTCKIEKPISEFPNNATSLSFSNCSSRCKECLRFANKFSKLKRAYNITKECFLLLIEKQSGKCSICNISMETFSFKNNKSNTVCVDHCHKTGKIRGLICNCCNRAIGLFKDNPDIVFSAYRYLVHFKQGELLETPKKDNQQPSLLSNEFEGSTTNSRVHKDGNADTSTLQS